MQNVILSALISRSNFADLSASATASAAYAAEDGESSSADAASGEQRTGSGFDVMLASMTAMQQSLSQYSAADSQGSSALTADGSSGVQRDSTRQQAEARGTDDEQDGPGQEEEGDEGERAQRGDAAERAQPLQPWEVSRQLTVRETPAAAQSGAEAGRQALEGRAQPQGGVPLPEGEAPDLELDPRQLQQLTAALQGSQQGRGGAQENVLFAGLPAELNQAAAGQEGRTDALMQLFAGRQAPVQPSTPGTPAAAMTTAELDSMARELNVTSVSMKYLEPQDSADSRSLESTLELIRQSRAQLTADGEQTYAEVAREQFLQRGSREAMTGAAAEAGAGRERITIDSQARTAGARAAEGAGSDPAVAKLSEAGAARSVSLSQGGQSLGQGQGQSMGQQGQGSGSLASMMAAQEQMLNQGIRTGRAQSQNFMQFSRTDAQHNAAEIHERVMEMSARNLRELSIDLDPAELGRMQINISLDSHNDALSVSLAAASPVTRELLEQTQGSLRALLQQDHIELDTRVYSLGYEDGGSSYGDAPDQGQGGWQGQDGSGERVLFADAAAADADGEDAAAELGAGDEPAAPPPPADGLDADGRLSAFA